MRKFKKLPGASGEKRHSLAFLNVAQFLGAMNDNIFKLILVFMLIGIQGQQKASIILSAVGAIYVIPFLLFSSTAGVLADRFSKQKLLVIMKVAECITMFLALFSFAYHSAWAGYTLLFLLASHSAMFGPAKYSIIPEIVPRDRVSKANGLITGCTYLAMIVGTFFASFLTEITHRQFVIATGFCFLMSVIGLLSTFGIKKTLPQGSEKKVNPLFIREIYRTLRFCVGRKHLLLSVFGSSYFLFVGSFTQLNIIPFAMESLHLSDVAGGYLFLSTALGIVIGSFIAGKASKKQVELGLTCMAGFAMALLFLLLSIFSSSLTCSIIFLVLLGIFGGAFVVPCDSYTQLASPQEKRGQIIAAANFLSFTGVLVASFALYFFSNFLGLSSAKGFAMLGVCTLLVTIMMTFRLSDLSLPYFARKLSFFWRLRIQGFEQVENTPNAVLILSEPNLQKVLVLLDLVPNAQLFIIKKTEKNIGWLNKLFYSIHFIPLHEDMGNLVQVAKAKAKEHLRPCFCLEGPLPTFGSESPSSFWKRLLSSSPSFILVDVISQPGQPIRVTFSKLEK